MNENSSAMEKLTNPWENRSQIGFFNSIISTMKMQLFSPQEFFNKFEVGASLKEPYLFYLAVNLPLMILGFMIPGSPLQDEKFAEIGPVIYPIMLVLLMGGIFVTTVFMHFAVKLFKGQGQYHHTFYILAYANGATAPLTLIPFIGGLISSIWCLVIGIIGYRCIHSMSKARAIIAYLFITLLIPLIVAIIVAAQTYVQRSLQAQIRDAAQYLSETSPSDVGNLEYGIEENSLDQY